MGSTDKFGWAGVMLVGTMTLGGCSSLMQGKQYDFPGPDEPSATLRTKHETGITLYLMNVDDEGCYAGYTPLPHIDGFLQAPVSPDKELILVHRREFAGKVAGKFAEKLCQTRLSFTPRKDAIYTVETGVWSETKTGILPVFSAEQHYCGLAVIKKIGEAETLEPFQQLRIDRGIVCHKFVK